MKKSTLSFTLLALSLPTSLLQFTEHWMLACILLNIQLLIAYWYGWPLLKNDA